MTELETVENRVARLSPVELGQFRRWFEEFDAKAWDEQIETDALNGKLDGLAQEALSDYNSGKATEV